MNDEEIKGAIIQILEHTETDIIADQIYEELDRVVDPGRTQEQIRRLIRELVNDDSYLVGSSSTGFFKIKTRHDAERAIRYLKNRIPDLQDRASSIAERWNIENPENQVEP